MAFATLTVFGVGASTAHSHPLHTTLTEISLAPDGQLQIVLRAPSGDISKVASTVATSARLCLEDPSKAQMYERPLRGAVRNLRRALEVEAPD